SWGSRVLSRAPSPTRLPSPPRRERLTVPLALIHGVTSHSTQRPAERAPLSSRGVDVLLGRFFQFVVFSDHESVISNTAGPFFVPSVTYRRSAASVTVPVRPVTLKRTNVWLRSEEHTSE